MFGFYCLPSRVLYHNRAFFIVKNKLRSIQKPAAKFRWLPPPLRLLLKCSACSTQWGTRCSLRSQTFRRYRPPSGSSLFVITIAKVLQTTRACKCRSLCNVSSKMGNERRSPSTRSIRGVSAGSSVQMSPSDMVLPFFPPYSFQQFPFVSVLSLPLTVTSSWCVACSSYL